MFIKFLATLKHDDGIVKLIVTAGSIEQAIQSLCRRELCPSRSIISIKQIK